MQGVNVNFKLILLQADLKAFNHNPHMLDLNFSAMVSKKPFCNQLKCVSHFQFFCIEMSGKFLCAKSFQNFWTNKNANTQLSTISVRS